jgi:hypothetical protein
MPFFFFLAFCGFDMLGFFGAGVWCFVNEQTLDTEISTQAVS